MLKRPSSRRHSNPQEIQINLVPMLDALVTMIAFLMYTMAFLSLSMIESPLPVVSSEENLVQLNEKPLQLTLTVEPSELILWSPFKLIPETRIPNSPSGKLDLLKLHEILVSIKKQFPAEKKVVIVPRSDTSYEAIVSIIDAARTFEKTDPLVSVRNPKTGIPEQVKSLFPETVFGNLLGEETP